MPSNVVDLTVLQSEAIKQQRGILNTRYSLTNLHLDSNNKLRTGLWIRPKISLINAKTFVLPPEMVARLDRVAALFYSGQVNLWWAIADASNIKDSLNDTEAGMTLLIPTLDAINKSLSGPQSTAQALL